MKNYRVFGGVLTSDVELPELPLAESGIEMPNWTLTTDVSPPPSADLVQLGEEPVEVGISVRLLRMSAGFRLSFDDTGTFDITENGRRITWHVPDPAPLPAIVRKDILGRVIAVALHAGGYTALHGSAVAIGTSGVAFVAPKYHGKSTTAAALVDAGAVLLSDDIVAITPGPHPLIVPAIPVVQLWSDAADHVGRQKVSLVNDGTPKVQVAWERSAGIEAVSLAAVYVLSPREEGAELSRVALTPVTAPLALLAQGKIAQLLGVAEASRTLAGLITLTRDVPVFQLNVPRNFDQVDLLARRVFDWHGCPAAAGT